MFPVDYLHQHPFVLKGISMIASWIQEISVEKVNLFGAGPI